MIDIRFLVILSRCKTNSKITNNKVIKEETNNNTHSRCTITTHQIKYLNNTNSKRNIIPHNIKRIEYNNNNNNPNNSRDKFLLYHIN